MHLEKSLNEGRLHPHKTSKEEILNLLQVVERDLKDASIPQLSTDRRFATAYNATLQLATIVLHAAGYRTKASTGHHWIILFLLPELMGDKESERADYFNACRIKRNATDYDRSGEISSFELAELLNEARAFKADVLKWLHKNHSELSKQVELLRKMRVK